MKQTVTRLLSDFQIKLAADKNWRLPDLELLHTSIALFVEIVGGRDHFKRLLGEVLVEKADTGSKLALAYKDRIQLSATGHNLLLFSHR
jgi:hypothetical protein